MAQDFDRDISLRELILKIQDYLTHLRSFWKRILFVSLAFALISVFLNMGQPKQYTAELSFMLNVDERGLNTGISNILGQFGLGVGSTETNYDKIMELSRARIISEAVLLDSLDFDNKEDLIANHHIRLLEDNGQWNRTSIFGFAEDTLSLEGFSFSSSELAEFSLLENKAIKRLHNKFIGTKDEKPMFISDYDELTGIMDFSFSCSDENLAIETVKKLFDKLSKYYIDKSTEKQQYDYDILKEKYDSINYVLANVQFELASFEDSNKNLFRKKDLLRKNRLKVEEQKLQFMSGKAEEQLQIAKISLDNKTPFIQVIDLPIGPIKPGNPSLVFYALLGFLVGAILSVLYFSLKKMYSDIINQA